MPMFGESGYVRKALDAYWTRPWVTHQVLDALEHQGLDPGPFVVWEPACGLGHISKVFRARGYDVLSTDVHDHGYDGLHGLQDFLAVEEIDSSIQLIVTNPPYDIKGVDGVPDVTAEQFVRHALKLAQPVGAAVLMILRHEFDCAAGRKDLFDRHPYAGKFVLTKRPDWTDPSMPSPEKKASPRHNFSWFHWDWSRPGSMLPTQTMLPILGKEAAA